MIDLGPGPAPNDRERQLALDFCRELDRTDGSRAKLLSMMTRAFAAYRIELSGAAAKKRTSTRQSRESAGRSTKGE